MFYTDNKKSDILERFRIKAHLRRYVKDPVPFDEQLMAEGIETLKDMDYSHSDPSELIAARITLASITNGFYKRDDLTDEGKIFIDQKQFRNKIVNNKRHRLRRLQKQFGKA